MSDKNKVKDRVCKACGIKITGTAADLTAHFAGHTQANQLKALNR